MFISYKYSPFLQRPMKQGRVSFKLEQSWGVAPFSTALPRILVPVPQVTLQLVHDVHSDTWQEPGARPTKLGIAKKTEIGITVHKQCTKFAMSAPCSWFLIFQSVVIIPEACHLWKQWGYKLFAGMNMRTTEAIRKFAFGDVNIFKYFAQQFHFLRNLIVIYF